MEKKTGQFFTRRGFIKSVGAAGTVMLFSTTKFFSQTPSREIPFKGNIDFKYSVIDVKHLPEMEAFFQKLSKNGQLSDNKTYRSYVKDGKYRIPEKMPDAKNLIIVSWGQKIIRINFLHKDKKYQVVVPPGYCYDEFNGKDLQKQVYQRVIKKDGWKMERARVLLKQAAVRSGLAQYGKNNITFVKGYGSYHAMTGYFTNYPYLESKWQKLKMLRYCKGCYICIKECPTKCITEDNFVIDVGKCITLYNEQNKPMPDHIPSSVHHTLVGCLKCQFTCPANEQYKTNIEQLADITPAETEFILKGGKDEKFTKSVKAKLKKVGLTADLTHLSRNLKLLIKT